MTDTQTSGNHPGASRGWLFVAVATAVAALLFAAVATGLVGGSADKPARTSPTGQQAGQRGQQTGRQATPTDAATPRAGTNPPKARLRAAPMPRSEPVRLRIPRIGVDSELMALGLKADKTLETPPGAFPAGWFTGAPTPGEQGPAIIVGHVRYNRPGVFARLAELRADDQVTVLREDGRTARFRIVRVAHFRKSAFPTNQVYGRLDHAGLRLITCGGLDATTNEFDENVVVFADLA